MLRPVYKMHYSHNPQEIQEKVHSLVESKGGAVVDEFTEIERGRKSQRPAIAQALEAARKANAVLVIAKLNRLAREAELVNRLSKEVAENDFPGHLFADLPDIDATKEETIMRLATKAHMPSEKKFIRYCY